MKQTIFSLLLVLSILTFSACSSSNPESTKAPPADSTISTEADIPTRAPSTSPYVRQRWAQDLQVSDVAKIEIVSQDYRKFTRYSGEDLGPLVELINAIDGDFVTEAIVSGRTEDIYPSTLHVFTQDDTRYTIEKIAGVDDNYISIGGSIFICDDALFNQFPEAGTESFPENYTIEGNPPQEKIPPEQRSKVTNIAPEHNPLPTPQGYETYDWMVNLKAGDVEFIEFVNLSDTQTPYRRYEGEDIQEVIDLFGSNLCFEYSPSVQWQGYFNQEFHIVMKDGAAHTVCSVGTVETVIDGAAFSTISEWIIGWPETGNAPLPEDWAEQVASRNYDTCEAEKSTLSTDSYQGDRASLDHQYDTDTEMGSASRYYPIGRSGVELCEENPTATGLTLRAYWSGTPFQTTQLHTRPDYWLEQWVEDGAAKGYIPVDAQQTISGPAQQLTSREDTTWTVTWQQPLEPGHYRLGMTFYETQNSAEQNETICYAKFSIS